MSGQVLPLASNLRSPNATGETFQVRADENLALILAAKEDYTVLAIVLTASPTSMG